jgi:hypothetical protein
VGAGVSKLCSCAFGNGVLSGLATITGRSPLRVAFRSTLKLSICSGTSIPAQRPEPILANRYFRLTPQPQQEPIQTVVARRVSQGPAVFYGFNSRKNGKVTRIKHLSRSQNTQLCRI